VASLTVYDEDSLADQGKEIALQFTPEGIMPRIAASYRELLDDYRAQHCAYS